MPDREFLKHHESKVIRERARQMRKAPTPSESLLWQALRNPQLAGLKFLRQHPIGPAIVDFYCHERHLAVEVDGGVHLNEDAKAQDTARQQFLQQYGVRFFRCTAEEVETDLIAVLSRLKGELDNL